MPPVVALLTPPALDEGRHRRDARLRHFALEMCEVAHTLAWGNRASIPHAGCETDACHAGVAKIEIAT